MNEITKEELDNFLKMQDRILNLIEEKTKELSLIIYNRLPEGEICWVDICESEFRSECIFVEFEGGCCKDQYNLPMKFLYDKDYPDIFKREFNEKNKLLKEIEEIKVEHEKLKEDIQLEKYELSEYERLKSKYE